MHPESSDTSPMVDTDSYKGGEGYTSEDSETSGWLRNGRKIPYLNSRLNQYNKRKQTDPKVDRPSNKRSNKTTGHKGISEPGNQQRDNQGAEREPSFEEILAKLGKAIDQRLGAN